MVKLTVILVRSGETEAEAFDASKEIYDPEGDAVVEYNEEEDATTGDDDHHPESSETQQDFTTTSNTEPRLRLCQRIDPTLTLTGFQQAQDSMTHILQALADSTPKERRLSAITAPTKACTGTSLMLTCAVGHDNLRWQLATVSSLEAPCAVPIVVHNILCTAEPELERCGGHGPVVDAGLLHCAAASWNDARQKCPFSKVLKTYKSITKEYVREWKEDANDRRCITR